MTDTYWRKMLLTIYLDIACELSYSYVMVWFPYKPNVLRALRFKISYAVLHVTGCGYGQRVECCDPFTWLIQLRSLVLIDPSNKSHDVTDKYFTMYQIVTEMFTRVHISDTKLSIVGYGTSALWSLRDGPITLKCQIRMSALKIHRGNLWPLGRRRVDLGARMFACWLNTWKKHLHDKDDTKHMALQQFRLVYCKCSWRHQAKCIWETRETVIMVLIYIMYHVDEMVDDNIRTESAYPWFTLITEWFIFWPGSSFINRDWLNQHQW